MWHWSFNRRRLYLFAGEMRKIQWNPPKKDREFIVTMKNNSILPQNYKIMICCSLAIIGGKRIIYNSILAHHQTSIDRVREKNCITMELWILELQCKRIGSFWKVTLTQTCSDSYTRFCPRTIVWHQCSFHLYTIYGIIEYSKGSRQQFIYDFY